MARKALTAYQKRVMVCDDCGTEYSHPGRASRYCPDCKAVHKNPKPRVVPDVWYDQAARWVAGETLEAIATDEGVSREAVRLRIAHLLPARTVTALKEARKAERPRRRVAKFKNCSICGAEFTAAGWLNARWSFCPVHTDPNLRGAVMLMCETERHEKHSVYVNGHEPTYDSPAWVTRTANGTGRFLVRGSRMHSLVLEAYEKGWPLWDRLPPEIRDWVERGGTLKPARVCVGCGVTYQGYGKSFCSQQCYGRNQAKRAQAGD